SHPELTLTTTVSEPTQVVEPTSVSAPTKVVEPSSVSEPTQGRVPTSVSEPTRVAGSQHPHQLFVEPFRSPYPQQLLASFSRLSDAHTGSHFPEAHPGSQQPQLGSPQPPSGSP
ncbi:hypothetical protein A4X13_0g9314, partial [Tilletia indica]